MKKKEASCKVMNNTDLRKIIFSFFRTSICETCNKYKVNCIRNRKFCICYECFFENWKSLWHL